jgi:hypothetical protein
MFYLIILSEQRARSSPEVGPNSGANLQYLFQFAKLFFDNQFVIIFSAVFVGDC